MQQFALANNFTYTAQGTLTGLDGGLFYIGSNRRVFNLVSGTYQDYPITVFNYSYVTGSGKSAHTWHCTVFELDLQNTLPDILLKRVGQNFGGPLCSINENYLQLEGDFNQYFMVDVTKGYEIETLQILSPDVMEKLIDNDPGFSMEIVNNHLFIYANKTIQTTTDLNAFYATAEYFVNTLGPTLAKLKSYLN